MQTAERKKLSLRFGRMSNKTVSDMATKTLGPEVAASETQAETEASPPPDPSVLNADAEKQRIRTMIKIETLKQQIKQTEMELKNACDIAAETATTPSIPAGNARGPAPRPPAP